MDKSSNSNSGCYTWIIFIIFILILSTFLNKCFPNYFRNVKIKDGIGTYELEYKGIENDVTNLTFEFGDEVRDYSKYYKDKVKELQFIIKTECLDYYGNTNVRSVTMIFTKKDMEEISQFNDEYSFLNNCHTWIYKAMQFKELQCLDRAIIK